MFLVRLYSENVELLFAVQNLEVFGSKFYFYLNHKKENTCSDYRSSLFRLLSSQISNAFESLCIHAAKQLGLS